MKPIICPECGMELFPIEESKDFPDSTYTETCPYCFGEYSYRVVDGRVKPWNAPKKVNQSYNGVGKPGGSE